MNSKANVTAAMLAIGDELLSGRTRDKNIGHAASMLTLVGIDLKEVRIVPDEEEEIVAALNALRARYTYVLTSGGIGPTHDDITADAISKAFGVPCLHDEKAMELLAAMYERRGMEFTETRQRMARRENSTDPGIMKGLKEATAVLKDLAGVSKTLNDQGVDAEGRECGVVLLPPVEDV